MDWYFDFVMLFVTLCVITFAMTIYVRRHPTRSRYNKYIYTGSIPTITITTCEDMPNPLIVPSSEESSDNELNDQENSSEPVQESVSVTETSRKASLTVPILDDDYDDDEEVEIVEIETIPSVDSKIEEKHDIIIYSQEKKDEVSAPEKTEIKLDSDEACLIETETVSFVEENESKSDAEDYVIEEQIINESPPKISCLVNGFTWKYGTSHTVEDPLFPFSEAIEDEKPLLKNRFKKRLSQ